MVLTTVPMTDEARDRFKALSEELTDELRAAAGTAFTAILARIGEIALKLALIVAVGHDPAAPIITINDADWAIATTGVAGPTETDGAKVGTVWFAVVGPRVGMSPAPQYTELRVFDGDREAVRAAAVEHAFEMLLRVL